jgi:hypothetical protein
VRIAVDDGLVILSGRIDRKSTGLAAVGLTQAVAGVTGVVDRLTFDTDDTTPAAAALRSAHGPSTTRVGRRGDRPSAGVGTAGHGFAAYAAHMIRQEAVR